MMNDFPVASRETIRNHSRWLNKRDKWRKDYAEVANCIRATKSILKHYPNDRYAQINIRALRERANQMMDTRAVIRGWLQDLAYTYAPRDAVDRAYKEMYG